MLRGTYRMGRFTPLFSTFTQSHSPHPLLFWNRNSHHLYSNVKHMLTIVNAASRSFSLDTKWEPHLSTLAQTAKTSSLDESSKGKSSAVAASTKKLSNKSRRERAEKSPEGVLKRNLNECSKVGDVVSKGKNSTAVDASTKKLSNKARRERAEKSPEGVLKRNLNECSKHGDIVQALHLYDEARKNGVVMNVDHYNRMLYLCTISQCSGEMGENESDRVVSALGLKRGFEIFQQMLIDQVEPNEATFTNAARLAAAAEDPEMAFELLKRMKEVGIAPKLRSYGPALYGFCKKGDSEKAYEVDAHMIESGIMAEEPELSALLEVSVNSNIEDKVYEMLHRLRATVRQVSEQTLQIIEDWFNSEYAAKVGKENWDVNKVNKGIMQGGGGWHGQGWLGSGEWKVVRTHVDDNGMCLECGQKLVSIDIDPKETENFASSISKLACQKKEVLAKFNHFQKWLEQHGPFDAVVDGANVGLANAHTFSFFQLNSVVQKLRQMSPSKRLPLIILHVNRITGGPAQSPNNRRLIENWKKNGALYATPQGSNDDWYWLYAAVNCKCLLLTNDEMRDHLFQMLGSSFFPRWKEKHQIRVSASTKGLSFILPPLYSIVIQESANGCWHVPTVTSDDHEIPRKWLCATRPGKRSLHNLWTSTSTCNGT